ncbi:MAG: sugar phosphate isomerase/epimerase family protein [Actinomycetota bacterium]|nr:sugar phosphate isomerase/epimerase family protein [Actinomycetota bacterium]
MADRVYAAHKTGYDAIGIHLGAWAYMQEHPEDLERFDQALDETGLPVANIETLRGWASPSGPDSNCHRMEEDVWNIADKYESRYVQVIGDYTGTIEEAAEGFGSLCDRAAEHGLLVGLEAVPEMTNIGTLGLAHEIVDRANRSNGGLCFDSWHLTRSTNNPDDLLKIPGDRIFSTQWNDGPLEKVFDDYYTDTLATRLPPGKGEFSLQRMIISIQTIGSSAPIGLEVPSKELWECPITEAAAVSINGMRSLLEMST